MGAYDFQHHEQHADPHAAFGRAVDDALSEHGHGGYTGTIAEKHDFVIIDRVPRTLVEAARHAQALIAAEDDRIADKWGPAGALPTHDTPGGPITGWLFFGSAPS